MWMDYPMVMGEGSGIMMVGMALVWLLIIAALLLSIAALLKYLRSGRNG